MTDGRSSEIPEKGQGQQTATFSKEASVPTSKNEKSDTTKVRDIHSFAATLASIRSIIVSAIFLSACALFAIFLIDEVSKRSVVVYPITVPKLWENKGFSDTILANRLEDEIENIGESVGLISNSVNSASQFGAEILVPGSPSELPDVTIPGAGVSVKSLIAFLRDVFNVETITVSGEIVCDLAFIDLNGPTEDDGATTGGNTETKCDERSAKLRLRISPEKGVVINIDPTKDQFKDQSDYFSNAAVEIVKNIDPYSAAIFLSRTNPRQSLYLLEQMLDRNQQVILASNLAGIIHESQGNRKRAIEFYRDAIAFSRDPFPVGHNNIGISFMNQGELYFAVEHLRLASFYRRNDADILNNLGTVLNRIVTIERKNDGLRKLAIGHNSEAIYNLRRAIAIKKTHAQAHNNLGVAFFQRYNLSKDLEDIDRAMHSVEKSIVLEDNREFYYNLALIYSYKSKDNHEYILRGMDALLRSISLGRDVGELSFWKYRFCRGSYMEVAQMCAALSAMR